MGLFGRAGGRAGGEGLEEYFDEDGDSGGEGGGAEGLLAAAEEGLAAEEEAEAAAGPAAAPGGGRYGAGGAFGEEDVTVVEVGPPAPVRVLQPGEEDLEALGIRVEQPKRKVVQKNYFALSKRLQGISRGGTLAPGMGRGNLIIEKSDFQCFVHRGRELEGGDAAEMRHFFSSLLHSLSGKDVLSVNELRYAVEKARWSKEWKRYSDAVRDKAFCQDRLSLALLLLEVAKDDPLEGHPPSSLYDASLLPGGYIALAFRLALGPLLAPFSWISPAAAHLFDRARLLVPIGLRGKSRRQPVLGKVVLALHVLPVWVLGLLVTLFYWSYRPEYLLDDALTCALLLVLQISLITALLSSVDVTDDHGLQSSSESLAFRQTQAFPGGRFTIPDDQARIAQIHPKDDILRIKKVEDCAFVGADGTRIPQRSRPSSDGEHKPALHWARKPLAEKGNRRQEALSAPGPGGGEEAGGALPGQVPDTPVAETKPERWPRVAGTRGGEANGAGRGKPITEKFVIQKIFQNAEKAVAAELGPSTFFARVLRHLGLIFVSLVVSIIPALHRGLHGRRLTGGRVRVTFCAENFLPDDVAKSLGMTMCREQPANRVLSLDTYANQELSLSDFISVTVDEASQGSMAGLVVTVGSILWGTVLVYYLLRYFRWNIGNLKEHVARWRLFSALSNPSQAAVFDVPYVNLRHGWLPWLRMRLYLLRLRRLELNWAQQMINHLILAIAFLGVGTLAVVMLGLHKGTPASSWVPHALALMSLFSVVLCYVGSLVSRLQASLDGHAQSVLEEKWKLNLDASNDSQNEQRLWQMHSALEDLYRILKDRDEKGVVTALGVRVGRWFRSFCVGLSVFSFALLTAFIFADTVGIANTEQVSLSHIQDTMEASFAYTHAYHLGLTKQLATLNTSLSSVHSTVEMGNGYLEVMNPDEQGQLHTLVSYMMDCKKTYNCDKPNFTQIAIERAEEEARLAAELAALEAAGSGELPAEGAGEGEAAEDEGEGGGAEEL